MHTSPHPMIAGRYELHRLIGRGGMGEVWQAMDLTLQRWVAVKVVRTSADPTMIERFRRESLSTAAASHPGTVQVHDAGIERTGNGPMAFLVMELLTGPDLGERLRSHGPLIAREAGEVVVQAARTLAAVHGQGVVHRDIKPSNLVYDADRRIRIVDFGIAQLARLGDQRLTSTHDVVGSLGYLSPERGSGGEVGPPSDIYSLGCVFFEMLTGHTPYSGGAPATIVYQHATAPIPRVSASVQVPGIIDDLVAMMMAKEPEQRPTAQDVVAVLTGSGPLPVFDAQVPRQRAMHASGPISTSGSFEAYGGSGSFPAAGATGSTGGFSTIGASGPIPTGGARAAKRSGGGRRVVSTLLAVALLGVAVGGVATFAAFRNASETGRAAALSEALPETIELAVDVIFERDALQPVAQAPVNVRSTYLHTTDIAIEEWQTASAEIDVDGDAELRALHHDITEVLKDFELYRVEMQEGDRASQDAAREVYTGLASNLLMLAAQLPELENDETADQIRNLSNLTPAAEAFSIEREIMVVALSDNQISTKSVKELTNAEAAWVKASSAFYSGGSPELQAELDRVSDGTFDKGSGAMTPQRTIRDVAATASVENVAKEMRAASKGEPIVRTWSDAAVAYIQSLREVILKSTETMANDVTEEHERARTGLILRAVLTAVALVAAIGLGLGLYRSGRRSR
ncbi:protein kinase [Nocardioides sp. KC13]|uniref:non-specific serine/threonine protein kinase n=1 Tax=Nocardioides turkmenicus TaxID=2711220 RepID=A0A6M1R6Z6_9ACTN|nr:protein kinase [Nocardioides sp. KC13]NGN95906.1 protein kinase [Nocardioides sp. KC13]